MRHAARRSAPPPPPGEAGGMPSRGWTLAGAAAIAASTAASAGIAFRFHPVGDFFTESDFYGAYARGADALRHGHFDPSRYGAYGPVHEVLLALVGLVVPDLFTAARVVSLGSALAVLLLAWSIARVHLDARAAFWLVLLLAVNPTFGRYAISACGDMAGAALMMGAVAAVTGNPARARWIPGGALAALAALTRYNLACLLPAGLLVAALGPPGGRGRGALRFLAAFVAVSAPFAIAAFASGMPPGATLLRDAAFYLDDAPQRTLEQRYAGSISGATAPAPASAARLVGRVLTGVPAHLLADARVLLGWPAAAFALAGLAALGLARRLRPLLPLGVFLALGFLALAPVYYSERYSLALLPLALVPAAALAGGLALHSRPARLALAVAAVATLASSLRASASLQSLEYASLPTEALESGKALRRAAAHGERVLARKAHVAYAAGLEPVLFPDVPSLDSLAAFCRARDVRWLYYSWYEARLRPRFSFLLDTAAAVPGLKVVYATTAKPSATYEIGPGFGATPAWWHDTTACRRIAERVTALSEPLRPRSP